LFQGYCIIESQPNGDTLGYTYDSAGNRIALTFFAANGSESISTPLTRISHQ